MALSEKAALEDHGRFYPVREIHDHFLWLIKTVVAHLRPRVLPFYSDL